VVSASLPVQSVGDLIAYARAAPGSLNFSTPGAHTIYHLEGELFKVRTGVDIVHVPYKGLVQALSGLLNRRCADDVLLASGRTAVHQGG
jgi:tripartite-type tricarboxylate transporter receptor subunit TctC